MLISPAWRHRAPPSIIGAAMKTALATAVWLVLAAACQASLGWRLSVFGVQPDFLLVAAVVLCMGREAEASATIGFFAGLLNGAILGSHMMALTVSRTLACLVASRIAAASTGAPALTVPVVAAIATLAAGLVHLFLAPPRDIIAWLTATIGGAPYNAVLALPCYWLAGKAGPAIAAKRTI
jgi:rod shape-determining protein MreD